MSTNVKLDILWSPVHNDKFVTLGSDITLYEVGPLDESDQKPSCIKISQNSSATVLASQSANGVRCMDISYIPDYADPLLALGSSSGRITLTCLGRNAEPLELVGREFAPRYSRPCNSVSWCPTEVQLLATAYDKHRSDHCILLWDVNRPPSADVPEIESPSSEEPRPIAEMGLAEIAHSVSWSNHNRTLLASMNMKHIKIFDLRDLSNKAVSSLSTRYCYGVSCDPLSPWQLATRGDNVVCVWDTRSFDRPLLTLPHSQPVVAHTWCPTRRNMVCVLQREATSLRLHSVQHAARPADLDDSPSLGAALGDEAGGGGAAGAGGVAGAGSGAGRGPTAQARDICAGAAPLAAAAWHRTTPARLLALTTTGVVVQHTVAERVTLAWGARALAWWAGGAGGGLRALPPPALACLPDVAALMERRAHTHYGLKPELWQNAELAEDEALSALWHFVSLSKALVEDGCIRVSGCRVPGVCSVLAGDGYRSQQLSQLLPDLPPRAATIYRSSERFRALQLCGWGWGWEQAAAGAERALADGHVARAAALAAFHLRLRHALDILAKSNQLQHQMVALAIAGLSDERVWREHVSGAAAAAALEEPYLRALLHFLAAAPAAAPAAAAAPSPPDYSAVLETEMRLEDRVAFACIFLSDSKLREYVSSTADELVRRADLSGILLTGLSSQGLELLQRWVEVSGDVQSAALLAARTHTPVDHYTWTEEYRQLLERWKLWRARAALDMHTAAPHARQVCVSCGYCGKSVAAWGGGRARPALARLAPAQPKMKQVSTCPHCRKPLPRCAVCLVHLGTGAGGGGAGAGGGATGAGGGGAGAGGAPGAGAAFAGWFAWCLACSHGGHADHLTQWFEEHTECPVSSCNCRCNMLDPPDRT